MLIIPAIDLKDGKVVRLYQGKMDQEKVYSDSPADMAKYWQAEGARLIHVVDLNGALEGTLQNISGLQQIIKAVTVPIEFGGGVRTESAVSELLSIGVSRIVLGTIAFENQPLLEKIAKDYRDKIIVSMDIQDDGTLGLRGWTKDAGKKTDLINCVKMLTDAGIRRIIYTDIARDGTLSGPRLDLLKERLLALSKYKLSLIMAGGISSLEDLKNLKGLEGLGLEGVIVGKALYEKRFSLSEAEKC